MNSLGALEYIDTQALRGIAPAEIKMRAALSGELDELDKVAFGNIAQGAAGRE